MFLVEIRQGMVDEPVSRLVSPDRADDIEQRGRRLETPVIDGDARGGLARPFGDEAAFNVVDTVRAAMSDPTSLTEVIDRDHSLCPYCFFLEGTDESVGGFGRDEVGEEEGVVKDTLGGEHKRPGEDGRLGYCHESSESVNLTAPLCQYGRHSQKVHSLVLGFFKQSMDPASVSALLVSDDVRPGGERRRLASRRKLRR